MRDLKKPDKATLSILAPQIYEEGLDYEVSRYVIREGDAWYNCMTDEAVLVEDPETEREELIRRWFLTPKDLDLSSIVHLIRQRRLVAASGPGQNTKNNFVIFTTTGCNAHCEYCFEKGYKVLTMSRETASKVADYIIGSMPPGGKIKVKWFGGEPLVNKEAINIISGKLNDNNVNFVSELLTNGDLLGNCTDEELRSWHVESCQFTVDDVGEEYDRIKGLPKGAYDRMKESLVRLAGLNIGIPLRLHYDPEKGAERCYRVIDDLKGYKGVRFYVRIIYGSETEEDYDRLMEIENYIMQNNQRRFSFVKFGSTNHCMADSRRIACITPTGELTPCEHYAYGEHLYGSVFSGKTDGERLRKWKVREKYGKAECKECVLYPTCRKLVMCPAEGKCSTGYAHYLIECTKRAMRRRRDGLQLQRHTDAERT